MRLVSRAIGLVGWVYALVILLSVMGDAWAPIAIAINLVTAFGVTAIHELAHLIAGRVAGHRATAFVVYPLQLEVAPRRLLWIARRDRRPLGGYVAFAPAIWRRNDRVVMTAAGPAANLMLVMAAAAALASTDGRSIFAAEAIAVAAISMTMAVANLLPSGSSDGAKLLALWRGRSNQPGIERT